MAANPGEMCNHGLHGTSIGYARCSTDQQDLAAQRQILIGLGVAENRIYSSL